MRIKAGMAYRSGTTSVNVLPWPYSLVSQILPPKHLGQFSAQVQAETRPFLALLVRDVDARERREKLRLILGTDADARVFDAKRDRDVAIAVALAYGQRNAALFGELDCVIGEVDKNLAQHAPIGVQDERPFRHAHRQGKT